MHPHKCNCAIPIYSSNGSYQLHFVKAQEILTNAYAISALTLWLEGFSEQSHADISWNGMAKYTTKLTDLGLSPVILALESS